MTQHYRHGLELREGRWCSRRELERLREEAVEGGLEEIDRYLRRDQRCGTPLERNVPMVARYVELAAREAFPSPEIRIDNVPKKHNHWIVLKSPTKKPCTLLHCKKGELLTLQLDIRLQVHYRHPWRTQQLWQEKRLWEMAGINVAGLPTRLMIIGELFTMPLTNYDIPLSEKPIASLPQLRRWLKTYLRIFKRELAKFS